MLLPDIAMWLGGKDAGLYIGYSRDYIEDRALPWKEDHVPYKIRFKHAVGKEGAEPERKYFRPDLDALLVIPRTPSRAVYRPRFRKKMAKEAPAEQAA